MKGIKKNKIEDLSRIITDLKMVRMSVENYNNKYHATLRIEGLDEITAYIMQGIEQIKDEPEIDPFAGVLMRGGKK